MGDHTHIIATPTRIMDITAISTHIMDIMVTDITGIRRGQLGN